jgi:hypothetical protein
MARSISPMLAAGIVAGPLFVGASLVQAFTQDGFDITRHPISLLSLGEQGWTQITNFVVCGLLFIACGAGMRRALPSGRGSVWAPQLVALTGAGLVLAGVCTTDAGAGFPPGAPGGAPHYSWHGVLHEVGFAVTVVSWLAACLVFRSRYSAAGERAWSRACVAAPVAVVLVSAWPDLDSLSVRLVIGAAFQFAFYAALMLHIGAAAPGAEYAARSDAHVSGR